MIIISDNNGDYYNILYPKFISPRSNILAIVWGGGRIPDIFTALITILSVIAIAFFFPSDPGERHHFLRLFLVVELYLLSTRHRVRRRVIYLNDIISYRFSFLALICVLAPWIVMTSFILMLAAQGAWLSYTKYYLLFLIFSLPFIFVSLVNASIFFLKRGKL